MIDEISISNFKSIFHQHFSLARVNVFVGSSNSGKTNILEALGMAAASHDDALDREGLIKRGINPTNISHQFEKDVEILWYEKNSWKKSKLVSHDAGNTWKEVSWYENSYIEKMNNLIQFIGDGTIEGEYPFADESKNSVLNAAFRGSRNFRDYLIYSLSKSDMQPVDKETEEKIFAVFTPQQQQELKQYAAKPEVMYYLSLFSERRSPAFFAIESIDSFLEPDVCCKLMPFITQLSLKHGKQVFITTKNPAVTGLMNLDGQEQKLFLVKKAESGQTVVVTVKDIKMVETLSE